jgi:hypothetical protein
MTKMAKRTSLAIVLVCMLGVAFAAPVGAQGQTGAEEEYNLDLPGSGANSETPTSGTTGDSEDSDSGFPVIVVILIAGAGVAAGIAAWRMRRSDEPDPPPS